MRAEILSIGTEILLGHITDTNAPYLARHLAEMGLDLYYVSQVGDNRGRVTETLRRAWERAEVIVTTGGLGPTEDDVTREAISDLIGETPTVDAANLEQLRAFFSQRGIAMPERNVKQAWTTTSTTTLPNPRGTAPGWFVRRDGHVIIAMPGVPREMERMWEEEAMPRLMAVAGQTLVTRILRVIGLGESTVEERVSDLIHMTNPTLATYAKIDAVDLRISAKAATRAEAEAMLAPVEALARERMTDPDGTNYVFGEDKITLAAVIGQHLVRLQWQLAALESCTGGLFASMLTDAPGSSAYFRGGVVTYATDLKEAQGVPAAIIERDGVISDATALAMAQAARDRLQAQVGVGITGVAGPDTQDGKPVGEVHIAVITPVGQRVLTAQIGNLERGEVKRRAVRSALTLLWQTLSTTMPEGA